MNVCSQKAADLHLNFTYANTCVYIEIKRYSAILETLFAEHWLLDFIKILMQARQVWMLFLIELFYS